MNPIPQSSQIPRLLLHFDLNGTLTLRDTSKQVHDEYMLISALAETTFSSWNGEKSTSFKQYVYSDLFPGDKSDQELKKQRQKVVGEFVDWLREKDHPALASVEKTYRTVREKFTDPETGKMNFTVFPSFYVMMDRLREDEVPFTIILRTFGRDLADVMREIEEHPSGVKFSHRAKFNGSTLAIDGERTIETAREIFDLFLHSERHFAVQDDWSYWNKNQERGKYGKPFFYELSGASGKEGNLSLFFDDNITGDEHLDIVSPCEVTGETIPTRALCDQVLFPVNTVEAMLDDNYFIDRVLKALTVADSDRVGTRV